jgi:TonB family protein
MRKIMLAFILAFIASDADAQESPSPTSVEAASAGSRAENLNKPRVKKAPRFVTQPEYIRPEAARSAGEFGEVVLSARIDEDGKVREPAVSVSSRSAAIDAAALASVASMLFEPARDVDGKPLSLWVDLALEFAHVNFRGEASLATYRCDQFVRDYDWWYRTWPTGVNDRIFKTVRGYVYVAHTDLKAGAFDAEWKAAIESCRASPNKLMLDMLKPHGSFVRQMLK